MSTRRVALGLLALTLAGCPNLSPTQLEQARKLAAQLGLVFKTVDAETGQEKKLDQNDIASIRDDAGKPIDYTFDKSGKMVFRPNKAGKQTITITLKDETRRQFDIDVPEADAKAGNNPIDGEVGLVPDAAGQTVISEVAIGGKVDPVRKQREQQQQFADRRVHLTFGGKGLEGLNPDTLAAVFFDLKQLPYGAVQVEQDGTLKMAPEVFFMVRDYRDQTGKFPILAVAFRRPDLQKIEVVTAELTSLPVLPGIVPRQGNVLLKPEMFQMGQELDLKFISEEYSSSFDRYKGDHGLMGPNWGGDLSPSPINRPQKLPDLFNLTLKTVNAETGQEETLDQNYFAFFHDDAGKPIDYAFDKSGKLVFRPNKAGKQTVTVVLKDGTQRQFEVDVPEVDQASGNRPIEGEVGFVPDAGGQNVTSEVAIGGRVDPVQKQKEQQQQFANRRIHLTFGGGGLEGLKPDTLAAVFFDLNQLPYGAAQVEPDGTLKMAPEVFFMVRDFHQKTGKFPTLAIAFKRPDLQKVEVVKAELTALPELPGIDPRQGNVLLKPDMFKTGQKLDLTVISEEYSSSFDQYKRDHGLMGPVYGGSQGIQPLPPEQQAAQQQQQQARAVLLRFVRPGLQSQAIKHVTISRYLAPLDAQAIVSVSDQGIAFRPEFLFGLAMARKMLLKNQDFPWVRVVYVEGNVLKSWKFRLKQGPAWFPNLDRFTGPMPVVPDGPLPPAPPWAQPGFQWPPFEMMGPSPSIEGSLIESTDPVSVTEDGLKRELENSPLRNP